MMTKKLALIISLLCLSSLAFSSCTQQSVVGNVAAEAGPQAPANAQKTVRISAENTDAAEPVVAHAPVKTAYIAWVEHRPNKEADVMHAHLDNEGRVLGEATRVNR